MSRGWSRIRAASWVGIRMGEIPHPASAKQTRLDILRRAIGDPTRRIREPLSSTLHLRYILWSAVV